MSLFPLRLHNNHESAVCYSLLCHAIIAMSSFSGIAVALFSIIAKLTATRGDSDDGLTPVEYIHKALFYFMVSCRLTAERITLIF